MSLLNPKRELKLIKPLNTRQISTKTKAFLRKENKVRTTDRLVLKLLQEGEYLGVKPETQIKNAYKIASERYNEKTASDREFENMVIVDGRQKFNSFKNFARSKKEISNIYGKTSESDKLALVAIFRNIKATQKKYIVEIGEIEKYGGENFEDVFESEKTYYTLNAKIIDKVLKNLLEGVSDGESVGSDQQVSNLITDQSIRFRKLPKTKSKTNAFFPYYVNKSELTDVIDFSTMQIFNNMPTDKDLKDACLVHSLKPSLSEEIISQIRIFVKDRNITQRKIKLIAEKFNLHIVLKPDTDDAKVIHYGDKTKEKITIAVLENHYFPIVEVPVTSYALENFDEIKHLPKWNEIYTKEGNNYKRKSRFINSYTLLKKMLTDKDRWFRKIPFQDLAETTFYKTTDEITSLDYGEYDVVENISNGENLDPEYNIVYFDFETTTEGEKHKPYLVCVRYGDVKKCFYGEDCGLKMLFHFYNQHKEGKMTEYFKFYAHNLKYDFSFVFQYVNVMKYMDRCGKLLQVGCMFANLQIKFQDTYAFIPTKLSAFSGMFHLPFYKEFLPYDLYTKKNVAKRFIDLNECYAYCDYQWEKNTIGSLIEPEENKTQYREIFLKNAKEWKCYKYGKIDIIEYSKRYCEMDCDLLHDGFEKFKDLMHQITKLNVDHFVSISSITSRYFNEQGVYEGVYMTSSHVLAFIQKCVRGGRTMCNSNNKAMFAGGKKKRLNDFDAVSLYPSAMERLGGYLKGKPKPFGSEMTYDELKKYDGYFVEIVIDEVGKKLEFPLMSFQRKDGVVSFSNDVEGKTMHVDKTTLEDFIQFQKIKFTIVRGYYFDEGRNYKLKQVIRYLFDERVKQKKLKNPIQQVLKLMMNSSYGKTILKANETENKFKKNEVVDKYVSKYYNIVTEIVKLNDKTSMIKEVKPIYDHFNYSHAGVEVLSMSKRIMNEVMTLAQDNKLKIFYQDTDSMHIDDDAIEKLQKKFKTKYGRDLIGEDLGQFHTDFDSDKIKGDIKAVRSIFLGKKSYIDELVGTDKDGNKVFDYHIRMKGIPNSVVKYHAKKKYPNDKDCCYKLYKDLYDGEAIEFDLLCDGKKVSFENNKMMVKNRGKFTRCLKF